MKELFIEPPEGFPVEVWIRLPEVFQKAISLAQSHNPNQDVGVPDHGKNPPFLPRDQKDPRFSSSSTAQELEV